MANTKEFGYGIYERLIIHDKCIPRDSFLQLYFRVLSLVSFPPIFPLSYHRRRQGDGEWSPRPEIEKNVVEKWCYFRRLHFEQQVTQNALKSQFFY